MRLSLGQYAIRLTCGLGLLLLPAVQQKVCTRPATRKPDAHQPAPVPAAGDKSEKKTKKPLSLAATLPDVVPPRWPNHAHLTGAHRVRRLPAATWMNGPAGTDDESAGAAGVDPIFAAGWPKRPAPQRLATFGSAGIRLIHVPRHLFQTSILKTGPPSA